MAAGSQLPPDLELTLNREIAGWTDELRAAAAEVYRAKDAEESYDAERAVAAALRSRADQLVGAVLRYRTSDPESEEAATKAAMERAKEAGLFVKSHGRRPTRVRLLGGTRISLRTKELLPERPPSKPGRKRGVGRRGKGGAGVYPALAVLGIVGQSTPALMAEVAREVAEANSVAVAWASLRERGLELGHRTTLRLTYLLAERGLALRQQRFDEVARAGPVGDGELAGQRVVVSVDGGRLRTRLNPKGGRRNAKTRHRRYKAPWKEPRVMSVYVLDDEGNKDRRFKTFLDATMGDCAASTTSSPPVASPTEVTRPCSSQHSA